jgi:hypothetical protein
VTCLKFPSNIIDSMKCYFYYQFSIVLFDSSWPGESNVWLRKFCMRPRLKCKFKFKKFAVFLSSAFARKAPKKISIVLAGKLNCGPVPSLDWPSLLLTQKFHQKVIYQIDKYFMSSSHVYK